MQIQQGLKIVSTNIVFLIFFFFWLNLGVLGGIYLFNPENFQYYLIIPSFPDFL
jgi:hypothetical protein